MSATAQVGGSAPSPNGGELGAFSGLLESLLDPVFVLSADDGAILSCNAAALRWQAAERGELVGRAFQSLFPEADRAPRSELLSLVRVHGHVFVEQVFVLRNGRTARADLSASLHQTGERLEIVVHLRDAEPRLAAQRLEGELREAAVRARTIAELNHEINNPLQALLLETTGDGSQSVRQHVLQIAEVLRRLRGPLGDELATPPAAVRPGETAAPCAAPAGPVPCRVLVADDHAVIRRGMTVVLKGAIPGLVVDQAADGVEAVERFQEGRPAVVVLDISMPRKTGDVAFAEILALCRERGWPEPRVVFCTGYTPPDSIRAVVEAPGSRHLCLLKPVEPQALLEAVGAALAAGP